MNSFGMRFKITTFGESHGEAIGCVIDGVPAGLKIDKNYIQKELDEDKPGKNLFSTARKEEDTAHILSGIFEGHSTGAPICIVIYNNNQRSKDYSNIKNIFRPAHADFTYYHKYGIRDYRGGGRSSARETAARVAAGAIAKLLLKEVGIKIEGGVFEIAGIQAKTIDFEYAKKSEIFALDSEIEELQKEAILKAKKQHDSVGGVAFVKASNIPYGLGEPIYYKLDAILSEAMMSINAVKAVEIGLGIKSARILGSKNNDQMSKYGFISNNAGGVLGGISNGEPIEMKVYFKPTPSIFKQQKTIDTNGKEIKFKLKGRHDPCVAIRGSVVAEAMMSLVLADMLLLNTSSTVEKIRRCYNF